jgi:hypothetical protein
LFHGVRRFTSFERILRVFQSFFGEWFRGIADCFIQSWQLGYSSRQCYVSGVGRMSVVILSFMRVLAMAFLPRFFYYFVTFIAFHFILFMHIIRGSYRRLFILFSPLFLSFRGVFFVPPLCRQWSLVILRHWVIALCRLGLCVDAAGPLSTPTAEGLRFARDFNTPASGN